jgi:SAM-dependent methyltransferase
VNVHHGCKNEWDSMHHHRQTKHRRGPSSFAMHDPELVFGGLKLKEGDVFLDLGCGSGDYAIHASKLVGDSGSVYALDIWEELIGGLIEEANAQGLRNIKAMVSDITRPLPVEDQSVDVCLIATVLHMPNVAENHRSLFGEIRRVLKPDGRVAVIECKKKDLPFGPPLEARLAPEELEDLIAPAGFKKVDLVDLGYNYLIQFGVK